MAASSLQSVAVSRSPRTKSTKTVRAINPDTGKVELVQKSEAVAISCVPQVRNPWGGDGIPCIPASARMFARGSHPTKLTDITVRKLPGGGHWVNVQYKTTRHPQYTKPDGTPVYMYTGGCWVRNERDVADPWFDTLNPKERARILCALNGEKFDARRRGI